MPSKKIKKIKRLPDECSRCGKMRILFYMDNVHKYTICKKCLKELKVLNRYWQYRQKQKKNNQINAQYSLLVHL